MKIQQYISSHALSRYNSALASFRTCLLGSLTGVEELIAAATEVQEVREMEKLEQERARLDGRARRSDEGLVAGGADTSTDAGRRTPRQTRGGGLGGVRLRSMWLLESPALTRESHSHGPTRNGVGGRGRSGNTHDATYASATPSSNQRKSIPNSNPDHERTSPATTQRTP